MGGAERYVSELAKALSKFVEVDLVSFGSLSKVTRVSDSLEIKILRSTHLPRTNIANPVNIQFLRHLKGAEVVHCAQPSTLVSNLAVVGSRLAQKKIYATDLGGGGISFRQIAHLDRFVTRFLSISKFSAKGYPVDKVRVIYGGVNSNLFYPRAAGKDAFFLYVGRVLPHKGVNYLIEALPKGASLQIIGKRSHSEYQKLLTKIAQDKEVQFLDVPGGDKATDSDSQLAQVYSRALATILPSVYVDVYGRTTLASELLGLVLLESQACGTPVICTDVGGMPEIVEAGRTGFVVPPNDPRALQESLQYFVDNPNEAKSMGQRGMEKMRRHFTWDAVGQRCLEAYSET